MNVLVKHYAGSIAYGTNLPTSDVDFRGIYCDPPREVETPWSTPRTEQWEDKSEEDTVLTELHKYMIGYVNGSPNVLESLWVDRSAIVQGSEVYDYLRENAQGLLSRKLRYTFGGYALGQMQRIKGHHKWINNPQPEAAPIRADYFKLIQNYLPVKVFARDFNIYDYNKDHILVPYGNDIYAVVASEGDVVFNRDKSIKKVDYSQLSDSIKKAYSKFIVKLCEDAFKADLDNYNNYWKWKRERNEVRAALEAEHGFDCKNALHIVRLLRMAEEVLTDGVVRVKRDDAVELLEIRAGKWKYEELLEWAEHQDAKLDGIMKVSPLPPKVDLQLAKRVLITAEDMANELT